MGKDWKSCKSGETGHSVDLQWKKMEKVINWVKLAILIQSELFWWQKIGKVVNQAKLAVPSYSELLWWEKIGKVANQAKLAIVSCFGGKSCKLGKICCSKSF